MNCKETLFELITSIEAYPVSAITFSVPFENDRKCISQSDFTADKSKSVQVPMKAKSGEFTEKTSVALPGKSHEVTVTWQVKDVSQEDYDILDAMNKNVNHLIIKTYAQTDYLLRTNEFGYRFTYNIKGGELDCELVITNIAGAQRIF